MSLTHVDGSNEVTWAGGVVSDGLWPAASPLSSETTMTRGHGLSQLM